LKFDYDGEVDQCCYLEVIFHSHSKLYTESSKLAIAVDCGERPSDKK